MAILGNFKAYLERPLKVGVLVSHPIQYFVPVYRELAKDADIELRVMYRTRMGVDAYHDPGFGQSVKWDIPLLDGYQSEFLSDKTSLNGFEIGIFSALCCNRFDVVIVHGYSNLSNLFAIVIARIMGTQVIVRGDTRLQPRHKNAPLRKRIFKRALFKLFDGFLTIGSLNRAYYMAFGAPKERIFFAPFCVNNSVFSLDQNEHQKTRLKFRDDWNLPTDCTAILFASKFTKQKRPADLIEAFSTILETNKNSYLVMAGAGPEEGNLRCMADALCPGRARFVGFKNQSELPSLYAASDIFVLPSSEESWGLVVNEVMAAGLPVIVSDEVGAAPDLVNEKHTGIIYPCGDVDALAKALERLIGSENERLLMGVNAHQLIREWDVNACAKNIVLAVKGVAC